MRRVALLSVVAGVGLGVAARIAMRFVALESGIDPGFSVGGSTEVVAFAAALGTPLALAFLIIRRRVSWALPWPGVAYGLLVFAMLWTFQPPAAQSALAGTPDTPLATTLAFATLFVAWGLGLEGLAGYYAAPNASASASTSRMSL